MVEVLKVVDVSDGVLMRFRVLSLRSHPLQVLRSIRSARWAVKAVWEGWTSERRQMERSASFLKPQMDARPLPL